MEQRLCLHIVGGNSRSRAELARLAFELSFHAEVYADFGELLTRPLRAGIIIAFGQVLDEGMKGLIDRLGSAGIWLPIVPASHNPLVENVVEAIKAGALDYLALPVEKEEFARMIGQIKQEAGRHTMARRRLVEARQRIGKLSKREREVLDWLSEGCSNKAIARALDISPRTVEIHRANMLEKLGAQHAAEAVRLKMESGLETSASVQLPAEETAVIGKSWSQDDAPSAPMERSAFA